MAEEDVKETTATTEAPETSEEPVEATVDTPEAAAKPTPKKKKAKRSVSSGQVHILATFNNTIVTFTDPKGAVLTTASAGGSGFRGSKKGTAYAAQVAAERAGQAAKQQHGLSKVDVYVKGIGLGREAAIRSLQGLDIAVESIKDVTGVPHGGTRPRKARRV
jgi:small subunit ribosomal protein S11